MKKLLIFTIIIFSVLSFSNPNINKPWNYSFNPALVDYGTRNLIDIGVSGDVNFIQPFINFGDLFKDEIIIDFNDIYDNLGEEPLPINLNADVSAFGKIHLWFLSYAKIVDLKTNTKVALPNDLMKLLSYGNVENGVIVDLNGEGFLNSNIIFTDTNYLSFVSKNSIFGLSFSNFLPIAIIRSNVDFNQTSNIENATLKINYNLNGDVYSSLKSLNTLILNDYDDYDNHDSEIDEDILNSLGENAGLKMSFGYINKSNRWGISINDIVIKNAEMKYTYTLSATGNILVDNMNIETDQGTPTLEMLDESSSRVFPEVPLDLPMNISAFYTFNFLFDITPHLQYYFGKGLDWGINFDGNLLFIPFWLDISNKIDYWTLNTGFGINIHIIDINASVESASQEFGNILNFKNLAFKLNIGIGI
ncbi:hypothetical protein SAMN02745164_00774 [Marinitoga hydrogenitolerans DSM 16785]|uniref:DUF5723 domain-containing protein n=1 Tax=Marinitoga hydrogenitolerans (strain DSM 16785 / JCM 12826 / AT1271) TaxID=1122195 RepID=A0A1M4UU35_MARH1|nr:hypothetical protein [Marinitoga hydrogenitolerans]SHE60195.1 hypothetical protein SAMN02745164_00774 [Marinitoga hydrogenitolerans DSM 16785]